MLTATYYFYVDWNNDTDFTDANENISAYVLSAEWSCGSDNPQPGQTSAGACRLILDNSTSIFSSYNPAGIAANLLPGRRVKITMAIGGGAEVQMWGGYLESVTPTVGDRVTVSTAELIAYGAISKLTDTPLVDIAMQTDITTGAAMALVLTEVGIAAGDRSLDTGQSTLSKWWARDADALGLLRELESAECGLLREGKDGKLTFEDRAHRANAPHNAVQATYGTGVLNLWKPQQEDDVRSIYNLVETQVRTFNTSDDIMLAVISDVANAVGGAPLSVPAKVGGVNGSRTVWIEFPTPSTPANYLAVSDWTTVDYEANTAADGTGTDITTDVSATKTEYGDKLKIVFSNANASAAYLVVLRAHGVAIMEGDPIAVKSEDATSQTKYRKRAYPNPSRWLTDLDDANDYVADIIAYHKDPRPRLRYTLMANYNAAHLLEAQTRDVSDRIHIEASVSSFGLAIDGDFFVEYVRHSVDQARLHKVEYVASAAATHTWTANASPYTPKVTPQGGPPDDLVCYSIANGLTCYVGCIAWKWNATITQAEFRAKFYPADEASPGEFVDLRTVAEGGTLAHNGTTEYIVTGLTADKGGLAQTITAAEQGRWFYAFRFLNVWGWSVWSDGNGTPRYVKDYIDTIDPSLMDDGPPSDWSVTIQAGTAANTVQVIATRPAVHGHNIWFAAFQVKDSTTGSWYDVDADTGASDTVYNGSGTAHAVTLNGKKISKAAAGWGTAAIGDLIVMDMRGSGNFAIEHCKWAVVSNFDGKVATDPGYDPATSTFILINQGQLTPAETANVRIKIVKPPWAWTSDGYFGTTPGGGYIQMEYWQNGGDTTSNIFISDPILVPNGTDLADLQGRVWFENAYSRWDDDTYSATMPVAPGDDYHYPLTFADPLVVDCSLVRGTGKIFVVTLTGNTTLSLINAVCMQTIGIVFIQDGSGSRVVSLPDTVQLSALVDFAQSATANTRDYAGFIYYSEEAKYDLVAFVPGFTVVPSASASSSVSASISSSPSAS